MLNVDRLGDLETALNADAPFQASFTNTGSRGMTTFLTLMLLLLIGAGNIVAVTTTSRETWAFARDVSNKSYGLRRKRRSMKLIYTAGWSAVLALSGQGECSTLTFSMIEKQLLTWCRSAADTTHH